MVFQCAEGGTRSKKNTESVKSSLLWTFTTTYVIDYARFPQLAALPPRLPAKEFDERETSAYSNAGNWRNNHTQRAADGGRKRDGVPAKAEGTVGTRLAAAGDQSCGRAGDG